MYAGWHKKRLDVDGQWAGSLKRINKGQNGGLVGRMAGMQVGVMEL